MRRQTLLKLGGLVLVLLALAMPLPIQAGIAPGDPEPCDQVIRGPRGAALCSEITCPKDTFCCPLGCGHSTCLKLGDPC